MLDARLPDIVKGLKNQGRPPRAESAGPPVAALRNLLERVLQVDGLLAGIVWLLDEQGRLRVLSEIGVQKLMAERRLVIGPEHQQMLGGVLRQGQIVCRNLDAADSPEKPVCTVAIGPLFQRSEAVGALELFAAPGLPEPETRLLLQSLELLCEIGGEFLIDDDDAPEPENAEFWARCDQFTLNLQRSLDVAEVSAVAVNDARLLLGCDRVSLALQQGRRTVIEAVSGQERVQSRSNLVRNMRRLAAAVIAGGEAVTYRGAVEGFAPQIEQPLAGYVEESRSRMIMLAPLRQPAPFRPAEDGEKPTSTQPGPVIGCLVLEQATEAQPRPTLLRRLDLVSDHVAAALTNARQHSDLFLLPLWRALGRGAASLRGRRGGIAAAVALGLLLVGIGLAVVPWDYHVEADGRAMPVIRRDVFAPWDGDVAEVFVNSGDPVRAGDPLVRIESDDLDEEHVAALNEVRELRKQRESLRFQLQQALEEADRQEQGRLGGELMAARIQLVAAEEHERILAERIDALTLRAAIDGVVVTYQLRQNIDDRPVNRGELLLQVMDPTGPWQLELEVPEHRMGHLLRAAEAAESGELTVEYVPATAVELTLTGTLPRESIGTRSNQAAESGMIVEAFADIDPNDLPQRHIGANVTARVDCGRRSLGYVLFGDVIEFVQRHLWW